MNTEEGEEEVEERRNVGGRLECHAAGVGKVSVGLVGSVLFATVLVESMLVESLLCTGVVVESMVESVLVTWCAFSLVRGSGTGGVLVLPWSRFGVLYW